MKQAGMGAVALLVLCACERPATESPPEAARPEPVVVYASYEDENHLPSLFAAFTRETGIPVTVRHRPEAQIVSEVIEKRGSPPADLLLTRSVHGVWRAADEGALRPLQSDTVAASVPSWLRDPDDYWTAIGFDAIRVACSGGHEADCAAIDSYEDLGKPDMRGRLCLSGSPLAVNRTLLAGLVADHGVRPAELIVRGWIANLAMPPLETEQALLQAVEAGSCDVGIASDTALRAFGRLPITATWPQPGYFDVVAAGINRHARSPEAARRLVEWLVGDAAQAAQLEAIGLRPARPGVPAGSPPLPAAEAMRNAGTFGLHETEAVRLAERVRWN